MSIRMAAEVSCGIVVDVDTDDEEVAEAAARWALADHVFETCGGIDTFIEDDKEATASIHVEKAEEGYRFYWAEEVVE